MSYKHLSLDERYYLETTKKTGKTLIEIAQDMSRSQMIKNLVSSQLFLATIRQDRQPPRTFFRPLNLKELPKNHRWFANDYDCPDN